MLCSEATADFEPEGLLLRVQGVDWPFHAKAYVLLHKPAGTECSQKPSTYPSVYTLLPPPLRQRPTKSAVQGVQAVGRLDQDTTGMLLLSDDGQFIHRLSSPKKHVPKVYQVTTKHPVDEAQVSKLLAGVVLDDDPKPVRAAHCTMVDTHRLDMTVIILVRIFQNVILNTVNLPAYTGYTKTVRSSRMMLLAYAITDAVSLMTIFICGTVLLFPLTLENTI